MNEIMEHLNFLTRLFNFSEFKVKISGFYGSIIGALFSLVSGFSEGFIGISGGLFILLFLVMITDYITGLKASKKEGLKFASKKGLGWVFKFGSYMVFLAVSLFLRKELIYLGLDWMRVPFKIIHFYVLIHIFLWELRSIDENFERIGYSFKILKLADEVFLTIRAMVKRKIDDNDENKI
jgi:phage-related holin